MTASRLIELAERCEQASGPDRELDARIRCAVFAGPSAFVKQSPINGAWCIYEPDHRGRECLWEPRKLSFEQLTGSFTASLDAALSLLPEGEPGISVVFWRVGNDGEGANPADFKAEVLVCSRFASKAFRATAATPALALTAACLRALAQEETNNAG